MDEDLCGLVGLALTLSKFIFVFQVPLRLSECLSRSPGSSSSLHKYVLLYLTSSLLIPLNLKSLCVGCVQVSLRISRSHFSYKSLSICLGLCLPISVSVDLSF